MQTPLHDLEAHILRSAAETAKLLGVSYSHYCEMRSGKRPIPAYIRFSAQAHKAIPMDRLMVFLKERR